MELNEISADLGHLRTDQLLGLCWGDASAAQQNAAYGELVKRSKLPNQSKELVACLESKGTEWRIRKLLALMYGSDQPFPSLWQSLLAVRKPARGGADALLLHITQTICKEKKLPPGATIDAVIARFSGNLCLAAVETLFISLIGALRATDNLKKTVAQMRDWLVHGFDKNATQTARGLFLLHCGELATAKDFDDAIDLLVIREPGQVSAAGYLAAALGIDATQAVVTPAMVRRFLVVLASCHRLVAGDRRSVMLLLQGRHCNFVCQQFLFNAGDKLPMSAFMGIAGFTACLVRFEFESGLQRLELFLRHIDLPDTVPGLALAELCEVLLENRYTAGFTWLYLFRMLERVHDDQSLLRAVTAIVRAQEDQLIELEHQTSWLEDLKRFQPRSRLVQLAFAAALLGRSKLRDPAVWEVVERALKHSVTGDHLRFAETDLLTKVIRELLFPHVGVAQPPAQLVEQALDDLVDHLGYLAQKQFEEVDRCLAGQGAAPGTFLFTEDISERQICAVILRWARRSDRNIAALLPHRRLLGSLCLVAIHEAPNDPQVVTLPKSVIAALAFAQQLMEVSLLRCVAALPSDSPYRPSLQVVQPMLRTLASEFTAAALALAYPGSTKSVLHLEPVTRLRDRAIGFFDALVAAIVPKLIAHQEVYAQMLLNGLKNGSLKIDSIHAAAAWRAAVRAADPKAPKRLVDLKCDHFDLVFCADVLPAGSAIDASPMCTSPELGALLSDWIENWRAALHALAAHLKASTPEAKALEPVLRTHLVPLLRALFGPKNTALAGLDPHASAIERMLADTDPDPHAALHLDGGSLERLIKRHDAASFVFVEDVGQACDAVLKIAPTLLKGTEATLLERLQAVHQRLSQAMKEPPFVHRHGAFNVCRFEVLPKDRFDNLFIGLALQCGLSPLRRGDASLVEWLVGPFLLIAAHDDNGDLLAVCALMFCQDKKDGRRVLAMDTCYMAPQFQPAVIHMDTTTPNIAGAALLEGFVAQAEAIARSFGVDQLCLSRVIGTGSVALWQSARAKGKPEMREFSLPPYWGGSPVQFLNLDDEASGFWSVDLGGAAGAADKTPDH